MYRLTIREHEMGEDPFITLDFNTFNEALIEATSRITTIVTDPQLDAWQIVDPTECCEFEVQYTRNEGSLSDPDEGLVSVDYILEIRKA